jgi:serine/threonine-protein kinase
MTCPSCGATTAAEARFCASCGQPLDPDVTRAAPPAPPTVTQHAPVTSAGRRSSPATGWLSSSDSISHGRFAPGAVLDGRYRIIGLLGRGGMGEVYRADDLRLGQPVALKFLPDAVGSDPARLAQFHNEVRTARQISHPNICRVYDIGETEGHLFLSMELVDGEDLASSLRRIGRFPEDKAIEIARQLCAGVAAAHDRGVLHRDLKPANVMLDAGGHVRLMDFGLAAAGAVDQIRAGTPGYMAPEQLHGREVTTKSDIYALGLVLYELFTGKRVFRASSVDELLELHRTGQITAPSDVVTALDPAIDRAILRCLDPEPARRPASARAVAAALPGGDPLAAAIAAGETPSPEMVAAAGEGAGLRTPIAAGILAVVLVGLLGSYFMTVRVSVLDRMRPEFTADVLAQKARDAVRTLGYTDRPIDEAFSFYWSGEQIEHVRGRADPAAPSWDALLAGRPSPLRFWYRRSQAAMTGVEFHHDLLTPGIVTSGDPPTIQSAMIGLTLDHLGWLTAFEAMPAERMDPRPPPAPVDWTPIVALAGLDLAALQPADPQWNFLAAADTRLAWTGTWPGSRHALRVEAAALGGRPVAFLATGPWTRADRRVPEADTGQQTALVLVIFGIALAILVGGALLAHRNLNANRGDRRGAFALAAGVGAALWALWLCEVHLVPSTSMLGVFLLAVCTTSFYGLLFWTVYLALEPYVRRHWPQTLVASTTLLSGRIRDPIVGRDVLFGVLLGVVTAALAASAEIAVGAPNFTSPEFLMGTRSTAAVILKVTLYALRAALLMFFLLFLLRLLLRNQWVAATVFIAIFTALSALDGSSNALLNAVVSAVYTTLFVVAVLRWGMVVLFVGLFTANLLLNNPATTSFSAWYIGATVLLFAVPLAMAVWAFYTAIGSRVAGR